MSPLCADCGRPLSQDETGLTRKLINRGTTVFYCHDCLSRRCGTTPHALADLIESFRAAGCTLFSLSEEHDHGHLL